MDGTGRPCTSLRGVGAQIKGQAHLPQLSLSVVTRLNTGLVAV